MSDEDPSQSSLGPVRMAGDKKQITRNRTSYSCQTCRRRKVRCDKQHPRCGGCIKLEEVCVYGDPDKIDIAQQSATGDTSRKRRATVTDAPEVSDSQSASYAFGAIEEKLSQLTSLIHDINCMTPTSLDNSPDIERLDALSLCQRNSVNGDDNSLQVFDATDHNDSGYHSAGHNASWDKVLGKLDQLNVLLKAGLRAQILPDQSRFNDSDTLHRPPPQRMDPSYLGGLKSILSNSAPSGAPEGFDAKLWSTATYNDMIAPSDEECAALFRSWLWSVYPVLPIVSPVVVWQRYHNFRQWYRHGLDRGEPNPDPSFMGMIVFIWYSGYANLSEKARRRWFPATLDPPTWMGGLRYRLEHYLQDVRTKEQASMYSLVAAISSHAMALGGQDIMKNHMCNILNLRAAQSLGVHSERTLKDLSTDEAETRRRLWWEALSLDASISTVSGMPVVFDERYTDTKMPSELKESCVGTQDATEYEAHLEEPGASPDRPDDPANWQTTSVVSVYNLVARARHILTVATKKVLKANMSATAMTMHELKEVRQSLQHVGDEVRSIINRIQTRGIPELDFVPPTNPPPAVDYLDEMGELVTAEEINYFLREETSVKGTTPIMKHHRTISIAFHKWSRIMLSMSLDRLDCISYAPFLKNSKSRLWAVARNCALRSCHGYMRKFLSLAEDPELRRFKWAWTCSFHPMHATIILLIDVHDRPHSDEAARSRAMIDKIFSLISPSKIIEFSHLASTDVLPLKEGGEEAWTMLRKLRHKAWQNAGLDPDVLWTEEDQALVGVGKPLQENDLFIRSLREDIIFQHKQMKERESQRASTNFRLDFRSSQFERAKNQRRHPSEVTQGDQVSGPVIRDIADLESISVVPQILLLRARNDQELMPYPVIERNTDPVASRPQDQHEDVKDDSNQQNDEVQVLHIGELIRKIQQTRRSTQADKATPVPQMYTSLSSQPLPTTALSKDAPAYDFRTLRSVENAAYQDIFDGHSTQSVVASTDVNLQGYGAVGEGRVAHSYFPGPSDRDFPPGQTHNSTQQLSMHQTPTFTHSISTDSPSLVAGNPPTSTASDHLFNGSSPQTTSTAAYPYALGTTQPASRAEQGTSSQYLFTPGSSYPPPTLQEQMQTQTQTQTQIQTSSTVNPTANDAADTGTAMDIEFDWNRWDEMFGQFAGFAEMLMANEGGVDGEGDGSADGDVFDGREYAFSAGSH